MDWDNLRTLIPSTSGSYHWPSLCEAIPGLIHLESTPQDPRHHAEGNVGIHTRMVLDALMESSFWQGASRDRQEALFMAALLHDIAKPQTTVIEPETGAVRQPGHSKRGAVDARVMLWRAGAPFDARENICRLIQVHQVPFFAFDNRRGESPEFTVRKLSWELNVGELACLAKADMQGRICKDLEDKLVDIALFEELAKEQSCWDKPFEAVDAHTRLMYARGMQIDPNYALHQEAGSSVTLLCGLPASGKDTWVERHGQGRAVVSFDDAKAHLGLRHGENDGAAAHFAIDKAKELLRRREPFIWNATHLSDQMREKSLNLLYAYNAEVEIVYLEVDPKTVFERNRKRDTTLSNKDIERMLHRWEVPLPWEAHEVEYRVGIENNRPSLKI